MNWRKAQEEDYNRGEKKKTDEKVRNRWVIRIIITIVGIGIAIWLKYG